MPLLTVVMAVKNGDATISKAIESILSQSFTNFELLIADDYSTDSTTTIINDYYDKRIKLVTASKPGLVEALNFCLQQAKGIYIARMDADDYSYPNRFLEQINLLENDPSIGVVSGVIKHLSTEANQEGYAKHVQWLNNIRTPQAHFLNRFKDAPLANPSAMFRKHIIDRHGLYQDFDGPEDYDFWLRLLNNGVKFSKVNSTILDWYDYSTRLTRNNPNYNEMAFSKIKAKYFSLWWHKQTHTKNIWIWGFGKEVFRKSKWLHFFGIKIAGYIDLTERPKSQRKVITHHKLLKENDFVLVYVSERTGQKNIKNWLDGNNFEAVKNYYFMT